MLSSITISVYVCVVLVVDVQVWVDDSQRSSNVSELLDNFFGEGDYLAS